MPRICWQCGATQRRKDSARPTPKGAPFCGRCGSRREWTGKRWRCRPCVSRSSNEWNKRNKARVDAARERHRSKAS